MELSKRLPAALAVLVLAGLIVFPAGEGGCAGPAGAAGEPDPPITVTADRMDYYSDRDVVIFIGNAIAIRGDVTLSAERMEVTLSQGVESEENGVRNIVAEGDVSFRQVDPKTGRERFATGERGEYHSDGARVDLTGNPRVWEGKNVVTGEKMSFYIDENRFVVQGGKDKPVGLTIYQEKKGEE